jgi:hypothetical protein
MDSGMTRGMKAHVSTMLTESGLSIPLRLRHFKSLVRRNAGCKTTSMAFRVFSVLTMRKPLDLSQLLGVIFWQGASVDKSIHVDT